MNAEHVNSTPKVHLSVRGVGKSFGAFRALHDIDLDIREGEFVCFLGPSGCGKTTLLRIIAGLTRQDTGRITQAGRDISDLPVAKRDFGIVFQSYALFPNLSVAANVAYGLEAEGRLDARARASRVAELLELVGLPTAGAKYPAQLSGGEQQRVALARALATSPGLLLLDEPLSALDARVRQRLRMEIKALQRRINVTTIMVTHDQEEALTMADRIVVMNAGRIEQIGSPLEIYNHPASAFVADFVGTMNLIDARSLGGRTVSACGLTLRVERALDAFGVGDSVTLCLRPEDVTLVADGAQAENGYPGRVQSLEFLGSSYLGTLQVPPDGEASIAVGLQAAAVRDLNIDIGSVIRIALPPQHLRIFSKARAPAVPAAGAVTGH